MTVPGAPLADQPVPFQGLSDNLVQLAHGDDRRGNALLICHPRLAQPSVPCLSRDEHSFGQAVCLFRGRGRANANGGTRIECSSTELPFQDAVFHVVTLFHLVRDGQEPELQEACRVLVPDGELIIVGLNRYGWLGAGAGLANQWPTFRPMLLRRRLQAMNMRVDGTLGAGLLGRGKPACIRRGWISLALPVADILLIRARHHDRALFNRTRMRKSPAGIASAGYIVR